MLIISLRWHLIDLLAFHECVGCFFMFNMFNLIPWHTHAHTLTSSLSYTHIYVQLKRLVCVGFFWKLSTGIFEAEYQSNVLKQCRSGNGCIFLFHSLRQLLLVVLVVVVTTSNICWCDIIWYSLYSHQKPLYLPQP